MNYGLKVSTIVRLNGTTSVHLNLSKHLTKSLLPTRIHTFTQLKVCTRSKATSLNTKLQIMSDVVHFLRILTVQIFLDLESTWDFCELNDPLLRGYSMITFQPFGMVKPAKVKSLMTSLKAPWAGDAILIVSLTTFQVYFIFCMSFQFNHSPGLLDMAISICSNLIIYVRKLSKVLQHKADSRTYWFISSIKQTDDGISNLQFIREHVVLICCIKHSTQQGKTSTSPYGDHLISKCSFSIASIKPMNCCKVSPLRNSCTEPRIFLVNSLVEVVIGVGKKRGFIIERGHQALTSLFSLENKNLFPEEPQKTTASCPSKEVLKAWDENLFILSRMNFSGHPPEQNLSNSRLSPMNGQPLFPGGRVEHFESHLSL
ncbi:hypothetical protein RJ641_006448 [Dillenia turbinata]|uniref:Uncharacterized protein n=1 Tax=Dillenia turbinata TaxID=194707 RepID=A0AAN8Z7M3_9MAGN